MKKLALVLVMLLTLPLAAVVSSSRGAKTTKSATSAKFTKSNLKHDPAVVKAYILKCVGKEAIGEIKKREGGEKFLAKFFSDQKWMEMFAGSGIFMDEQGNGAAEALKLLDTLCWNDKPVDAKGTLWQDTPLGRSCLTALALNYDHNWRGGNSWNFSVEKVVEIADWYRTWDMNGTLLSAVKDLDCRQWREVQGLGQNWELKTDSLKWIHDFATVPADKYFGTEWLCEYRAINCFGDSVHGPRYYRYWEHRYSIEELRYRVGGVCGGLSKFGSHCASSHGVRSFTAGEPGHCAFMLWNYKKNCWDLDYTVTGHSKPHFRLETETTDNNYNGDKYSPNCGIFPTAQEQDRYYQNPNRMDAEYLRWKGEYRKSMEIAHDNWQAASEWRASLKPGDKLAWQEYADTVLETFDEAPFLGWSLYRSYLKQMGGGMNDKLEAIKKGLVAMKEYKGDIPRIQNLDLNEAVLDKAVQFFPGNDQVTKLCFSTALNSYAHDPSFFSQTLGWGSTKFMSNSDDTKWYLKTVGRAALDNKVDLDYRNMLYAAAKGGDIGTFKSIYRLMDILNKNKKPTKPAGKNYPEQDYGGTLLSKDGLLQVSDMLPHDGKQGADAPNQWDTPITYRNVLNAEEYSNGNGFHTAGKDAAPFAIVVLPGDSLVSGVTVVNSGGAQNGGRQVPLAVWVRTSSSGVDEWTKVAESNTVQDEWKFKLPQPVPAKYIKVGRDPAAKKTEVFHLHKILVYGTKQF